MSQNALHSISIAIPHGTQQLRYSFVAKIISKCTPDWSQNPPQNTSKSFNSGSTRVQTVGVLPRMIFHRFWGPVLELEMLPKSDPKIKTFSGVPQELVLCDGSSQNAPKLPLKLIPKSIFFSGGAKLENLALASTGS